MPAATSTAVMTGNLTNTVLALMELLSKRDSLMSADADKLKRSVQLLFGFLFGCVSGAARVHQSRNFVQRHVTSWDASSSVRVVGGCEASYTMTAKPRRGFEPAATSRMVTPAGTASELPFGIR
jgi:hypothetical protein